MSFILPRSTRAPLKHTIRDGSSAPPALDLLRDGKLMMTVQGMDDPVLFDDYVLAIEATPARLLHMLQESQTNRPKFGKALDVLVAERAHLLEILRASIFVPDTDELLRAAARAGEHQVYDTLIELLVEMMEDFAETGQTGAMRRLISRTSRINLLNGHVRALEKAAASGHVGVMGLLFDATDEHGNIRFQFSADLVDEALRIAAANGRVTIIDHLLERMHQQGNGVNKLRIRSALREAVRRGATDVMVALLKDYPPTIGFAFAAVRNPLYVPEEAFPNEFIAHNEDADALTEAARGGKLGAVGLLLAHLNEQVFISTTAANEAFLAALDNNHVNVAFRLARTQSGHGPIVASAESLHAAASTGNLDLVRALFHNQDAGLWKVFLQEATDRAREEIDWKVLKVLSKVQL